MTSCGESRTGFATTEIFCRHHTTNKYEIKRVNRSRKSKMIINLTMKLILGYFSFFRAKVSGKAKVDLKTEIDTLK